MPDRPPPLSAQELIRRYNEGERDCSGTDLDRADLSGADLRGAKLFGANLSEADLKGARLNMADLSEAKLFGTDLRGANLYGVFLESVFLKRTKCDYETTLREGYTCRNGFIKKISKAKK